MPDSALTHATADAVLTLHNEIGTRDLAEMFSFNELLTRATHAVIDHLDPDDAPTPHTVETRVLTVTNSAFAAYNSRRHRGLKDSATAETAAALEKLSPLRVLTPWQIAQILKRLHRVIRIAPAAKDTDREYDLLAAYVSVGPSRGTYSTSEDELRMCARSYQTGLSTHEFKEIVAVLREIAPRRQHSAHRDLIAVNNGVFHYGTQPLHFEIEPHGRTLTFQPKTLYPFTPELVFLAKCHVDYVPDAENPVLHFDDGEPWDVVSWIQELSDDEGIPELLWEVLGAVIRPYVSWNKSAWFYSEQGNNGKGTLCQLARNLCGPRSHTSIPLADFGKDFALEPLVRATAIIVDENDVGLFVDKIANLKAVITGDVIQINRKHRTPIAYQFHGFMIQCLNEFPRIKDTSESAYRRQLFVPFNKSFTGYERREIKDSFLHQTDVLEYVLWHILHVAGADAPGAYYTLSEPPATLATLAEHKENNDPIRKFWFEFRTEFVWDLLPFAFLYDLYRAWLSTDSPSGMPVSQTKFTQHLLSLVRDDPHWDCPDRTLKMRPANRMNATELLIATYNLTAWSDPVYTGRDPAKRSQPRLRANYRGLTRCSTPLPMTVPAHAPTVRTPSTDEAETNPPT